jgi:hypothetical protein
VIFRNIVFFIFNPVIQKSHMKIVTVCCHTLIVTDEDTVYTICHRTDVNGKMRSSFEYLKSCRTRLKRHRFIWHLVNNVRYSVVSINSSLLTLTLHSLVITTLVYIVYTTITEMHYTTGRAHRRCNFQVKGEY